MKLEILSQLCMNWHAHVICLKGGNKTLRPRSFPSHTGLSKAYLVCYALQDKGLPLR